jgi:hypothetical protein
MGGGGFGGAGRDFFLFHVCDIALVGVRLFVCWWIRRAVDAAVLIAPEPLWLLMRGGRDGFSFLWN